MGGDRSLQIRKRVRARKPEKVHSGSIPFGRKKGRVGDPPYLGWDADCVYRYSSPVTALMILKFSTW